MPAKRAATSQKQTSKASKMARRNQNTPAVLEPPKKRKKPATFVMDSETENDSSDTDVQTNKASRKSKHSQKAPEVSEPPKKKKKPAICVMDSESENDSSDSDVSVSDLRSKVLAAMLKRYVVEGERTADKSDSSDDGSGDEDVENNSDSDAAEKKETGHERKGSGLLSAMAKTLKSLMNVQERQEPKELKTYSTQGGISARQIKMEKQADEGHELPDSTSLHTEENIQQHQLDNMYNNEALQNQFTQYVHCKREVEQPIENQHLSHDTINAHPLQNQEHQSDSDIGGISEHISEYLHSQEPVDLSIKKEKPDYDNSQQENGYSVFFHQEIHSDKLQIRKSPEIHTELSKGHVTYKNSLTHSSNLITSSEKAVNHISQKVEVVSHSTSRKTQPQKLTDYQEKGNSKTQIRKSPQIKTKTLHELLSNKDCPAQNSDLLTESEMHLNTDMSLNNKPKISGKVNGCPAQNLDLLTDSEMPLNTDISLNNKSVSPTVSSEIQFPKMTGFERRDSSKTQIRKSPEIKMNILQELTIHKDCPTQNFLHESEIPVQKIMSLNNQSVFPSVSSEIHPPIMTGCQRLESVKTQIRKSPEIKTKRVTELIHKGSPTKNSDLLTDSEIPVHEDMSLNNDSASVCIFSEIQPPKISAHETSKGHSNVYESIQPTVNSSEPSRTYQYMCDDNNKQSERQTTNSQKSPEIKKKILQEHEIHKGSPSQDSDLLTDSEMPVHKDMSFNNNSSPVCVSSEIQTPNMTGRETLKGNTGAYEKSQPTVKSSEVNRTHQYICDDKNKQLETQTTNSQLHSDATNVNNQLWKGENFLQHPAFRIQTITSNRERHNRSKYSWNNATSSQAFNGQSDRKYDSTVHTKFCKSDIYNEQTTQPNLYVHLTMQTSKEHSHEDNCSPHTVTTNPADLDQHKKDCYQVNFPSDLEWNGYSESLEMYRKRTLVVMNYPQNMREKGLKRLSPDILSVKIPPFYGHYTIAYLVFANESMADKNFKLLCERYPVTQGRKWYFNYTGPKSINLPFFSKPSTGDIVEVDPFMLSVVDADKNIYHGRLRTIFPAATEIVIPRTNGIYQQKHAYIYFSSEQECQDAYENNQNRYPLVVRHGVIIKQTQSKHSEIITERRCSSSNQCDSENLIKAVPARIFFGAHPVDKSKTSAQTSNTNSSKKQKKKQKQKARNCHVGESKTVPQTSSNSLGKNQKKKQIQKARNCHVGESKTVPLTSSNSLGKNQKKKQKQKANKRQQHAGKPHTDTTTKVSQRNHQQKHLEEKVPLKTISCSSPVDEILPTSQNHQKEKQSQETEQTEDHPLKKSKKDMKAVNTCELFVGGLKNMTKEMAEEKVKSLFPEAADIDIKMERTGARHYGLVSFSSETQCQDALDNYNPEQSLIVKRNKRKR